MEPRRAFIKDVIASAVKQSTISAGLDCFAEWLAMTAEAERWSSFQTSVGPLSQSDNFYFYFMEDRFSGGRAGAQLLQEDEMFGAVAPRASGEGRSKINLTY
jgi:hypothetical protein